ncbi:hypothetical protein [Aneurinibacillus tyrosinisolvens]|uniref:hypothetical protein n=1 Tax=Aneurinibacillus tyrosinisolvens TaxID=1443435 RepID=UPI00063F6B0D|nr:hypothetical protein [Aneurinibacillus tyrosinisolvens]
MQQIFGSHKCYNCNKKFDWTGELRNQVDERMRQQIVDNRNLQYARFSEGTNEDFTINVKCTHCNYPLEFNYSHNKKLLL